MSNDKLETRVKSDDGISISDILADMGLDMEEIDEEDLSSSDGFQTMSEVENNTKALRGIKTDFGTKQLVIAPIWLRIPFDIKTGKPFADKHVTTSIALGIPPETLLKLLVTLCDKSEEYATNLRKTLGVREDNFVMAYDVNTKKFNPRTIEMFVPFFNLYSVSELTQRYTISEDKTITRKALLKCNKYGKIDFDNSDQRLVSRYLAEASLLEAELVEKKKEMILAEESEKNIDNALKNMRSGKTMTPPRTTTSAIVLSVPSNSAGKPTEDVIAEISNESYKLAYKLNMMSLTTDGLTSIKGIMSKSNLYHANYVAFVREVPEKTEEIPTIGIAIGKIKYNTIGDKVDVDTCITNLAERLDTILADKEEMSEERVRASVTKFAEMDMNTALTCFANGLGKYKRALKDPKVVEANRKVLTTIEQDLGLKLIKDVATSNVTTITAEFTPAEDKNDLDNYVDSDDEAPDTENVKAEDFID